VNGLPKGALNITHRRIECAGQLVEIERWLLHLHSSKNGCGMEKLLSRPVPQVQRVRAEGAIQIKFVTANGTNDYHGGLYWYHRKPGDLMQITGSTIAIRLLIP
jgi:hypothetical protein